MSTIQSGIVIPDSLLAKEATEILREYSTDLAFQRFNARLSIRG